MAEKNLPHNDDLEEIVLGMMLMDSKSCLGALTEVTHPHQPQVTNPNAYLQPNSFHKTYRKKQLDKNHTLNEQTNRPRKEMLTH